MIKLKILRWKNFISYGNAWTEYNFTTGITRVMGDNGMGKSVLVDALNYALFGKPFRKANLPNIVNIINKKNLVVEVEFTHKEKEYKICRGVKPNIFNIFCDEKLVNQDSHKRDYQRYLEDEVYKFNESIFHQVTIKSLTRYESFLTLPKNKKRNIIEELFGITVLSKMSDLNKIEKNKLESTFYKLQRDDKHQNELIEQEREHLEKLKTLKKKLEAEKESERLKILKDIKNLESKLNKYTKGLKIINIRYTEEQNLIEKLKTLKEQKNKVISDITEVNTKIRVFNEKLTWLSQKCPTCLRVDEIKQENEVLIDKKEYVQFSKILNQIISDIAKIEDSIINCKKVISKKSLIKQKIFDNKKLTKSLIDRSKISSKVIDINENKFESLKNKLRNIKKNVILVDREIKYTKIIYELLQDEGIKAHIIKKYLPLLNKLLNTYLQKFGLDLELEFTYNFDVIIKNNFKNHLSYENFSQGEKKRIDASVMFCFLDFCKLKYNTAKINVLVFDEFTVGLDPEGEGTFYEILKSIAEKDNMEIITVSHSTMIDPDKIDTLYLATMSRGFSDLSKVEET